MIKVYIETVSSHVHFKNVDKAEIKDNQLIVYIGCSLYHYELDKLLTYEIRKDKTYV